TKFDMFWEELAKYFEEFEIKYKVQACQLRKSYPDTHFCHAIFKYLRHFAVKFRQYSALIFVNNKHKVPIEAIYNPQLKRELQASIKNIQKTLNKRTQ
ncbi:31904_t:CDS:2, partial [Gigaspora margarita]